MASSRSEIQAKSDEKRGIVKKGYSLPVETIELIASLSELTGDAQGRIIAKAVALYAEQIKNPD